MLTRHDVGQRVAVRRTVEGGQTDVLGHLLDVTDAHLEILGRGRVVHLDRAAVTAAKVVPPATPRRGWALPAISPDDLQRICWAGWPARESEALGDWALRAHGGITGRANSAMAVGDPGRPVAAALRQVSTWYAERGLPPLLQIPLADPANAVLADEGWARAHVTVVPVAPIGPVLAAAVARPDLRVVVEPAPGADWQALMHDLDAADPAAHLAVLTGPARVGFVTLYRAAGGAGSPGGGDGAPVGIGRVSVEGSWAGVTSVDIAASARRQGIGSAVMAALLSWAREQGASSSYLQVRAGNDAALRLYDALGYVIHHPYGYRAP